MREPGRKEDREPGGRGPGGGDTGAAGWSVLWRDSKAQEPHAQKKGPGAPCPEGPDPGHHQRPEGTAMTPTGQPHPSLRVDFTDTQTRRQ